MAGHSHSAIFTVCLPAKTPKAMPNCGVAVPRASVIATIIPPGATAAAPADPEYVTLTPLGELERQTHQPIAPEQLKAQLTIRNLVEVLVAPVARSRPLVTKVRDGVGQPLFVCHGDYDGWGFYARRLADRLEHRGPVYLLPMEPMAIR